MSQAWCGLCAVGPLTVGEMGEHYAAVHKPNGEPLKVLGVHEPRKRKPGTRPVTTKVFPACEVCGLPLLEDEVQMCRHCA